MNKVIILKAVKKIFRRDSNRENSFLSKILSYFGDGIRKEFVVLDNISLEVRRGENLGIIGKNGSGKSTLLRIIAKIYQPSEGMVRVNDKIFYLSGFGTGLKKRLTMRENIYLICTLFGLRRKHIDKIIPKIIDFSGLEEYVDSKVYQFSSGMVSRLNFSIIMECFDFHNSKILLLDEAFFGGGDLEFRDKAIARIEKTIKGEVCVLFVSHNLNLIERYCDRVIWLDNGKIIREGEPSKIVNNYVKENGNERSSKRYLEKKKYERKKKKS